MDGTLVDSRLDFDVMRHEMGLPTGVPILESLTSVPDGPDRDRMLATMRIHELRGADEAVLFDGVIEFLNHIQELGICAAVLTRNSRESTDRTLRRLNLSFSQVVTREDAPPKPHPAGVKMIAEGWGLPAHEIIVIGDYLFDLQVGRQAGMRNILFAPRDLPEFADEADYVLRHFREAIPLLNRLHTGEP
jgi:phosphoglycolate phosphatase-like HAD superfamily hydrolase